MHNYPNLIFAALLIFGFGLFSRVSEQSPISAAMVFATVGMVAEPIGPGFLKEAINAPLVRVLAEVTLVLVLFIDASKTRWMNPTFQQLATWSLAILAFASAESFHGNGFIAAFFGGLMLGTHTPVVRERIQEFGEAEGQQYKDFYYSLGENK